MKLVLKETPIESKPNTYSVSRLKTYSTCSEFYKLRYVDRLPVSSFSHATILGSLCHDALEAFYAGEVEYKLLIDAFKVTARTTLNARKIFHENIPSELVDELYESLIDYAQDSFSLFIRASDIYRGPAPIRKKDGGLASAPSSTSGWKRAEENLQLTARREFIDDRVCALNEDLEGLSLSTIFAEAYYICFRHKTPKELVKTVAVEFPISDFDPFNNKFINPVLMPQEFGGSEGIYLNGYVDWIGYIDVEGEEKLCILDYKSSKEDMTADMVQYNVQLYSYVYAYELLSGETVDMIGIFNLRSGNLVMIPVDREKMKETLNALFFKHNLIKGEMFYKHVPDSKYSSCLAQYGAQCPFLKHCWPEVWKKNNPEAAEKEFANMAAELGIEFAGQ